MKKLNFFIKKNSDSSLEIKLLVDRTLNDLVRSATEYCDYYKEKYSNLNPDILNNVSKDNIHLLPPLLKNDYKKRHKEILNKAVKIDRLQKFQSSGSTGEPKTFYRSKSEYGWALAALYYDWVKVGYRFGDSLLRISMFKEPGLSYKIFNIFSNTSYIALNEFNDNKFLVIAKIIKSKRIDYIYSYSSALYIVAEYCKRHNLGFKGIKGIITHGDILFSNYRDTIEKVFNCKIYDTYGGDGIVVSGQCVNGNYHINDTNVVVEIVDDQNLPVPFNQPGRVLLTNLHNNSAPLIRYDIGDIGYLKQGNCSCGLKTTLMMQPLGRDSDIIYLSNGCVLFVHFFTGLFSAYTDVELFQIVENEKDSIIIKLVVKTSFNDYVKNEIEAKIKSFTNGGMKISFEFLNNIPLEKSNKRRFVISKVKY